MTTILLVDNKPMQLEATRLHLEHAGYTVEVASSAIEALARARVRKPDLIVSDVLMADVDGFGLCRRIHDDTYLGCIPVVLVSSHHERGDLDTAHAVGASTLVERSPDFQAELAAVERCLRDLGKRTSDRTYEEHLRANANQLTRMREKVQHADERLRVLLDQAHDVVAVLTPDGIVLEANRRWHDVLGIEPAAMIGMHVRELGAPGHEDSNVEGFHRAICEGASSVVASLRHHVTGEVVELELTAKLTAIDGTAQVLAIGRDVTAQREATRKLVEAEAMYRSLVERIPDMLWRLRPDDTFAFVSPNTRAITGYDADRVYREGRSLWVRAIHPDDRAMVAAAVARGRATGEPYEIQFRFNRPDGRAAWLHSRVRVTAGADGPLLEGLTADITERRLLQDSLAQAQKLEAVGQLTGGIAHDFNNLLTVILSNTSFLLDERPVEDPRHADAVEVNHAAKRAAALTRQLLAFSRRQDLELIDVDANTVVGGLEKMLRRLIGEDVALSITLDPTTNIVRADAGQLEQVIVNLVVNARDAMPHGGAIAIGTSRISVAANDPRGLTAGTYVQIAVCDTGTGITPEVMAHMFEPFFTTKERGHGTGLGLSTCYGIVKHFGGHIEATSELGRGSELVVLIPLSRASVPSRVHADGAAPTGTETVLVIEDETAVRRGISRILRASGYHVLLAGNRDEALAIVRGHDGEIHLIVSDVVLPDESGPDIVAKVRALLPAVRVLMMSGYSDHADLSTALAGDASFLSKPFSAAPLARKVRDVLDREAA